MTYNYKEGILVPFVQKFYKQMIIVVAALFIASMGLMTFNASAAVDSTVVVTPNDMATNIAEVIDVPTSWFFYNDETDTIDNSLGSFVSGPATAPAGEGSAQISVSGTQRRNLATYQFNDVRLSDLTDLRFSTYNPSAENGGSSSRSAYLNFNVDFDNSDTWQRRLAYIPSQNGTIVQDEWQEWDAIDGGNALWWWSGFARGVDNTPGTPDDNKWPDGSTVEYRTMSDLLLEFPDISTRETDSWMGVRVGEPYNSGYTENIDKFVFGTAAGITTFDFDPNPAPMITSPLANEEVVLGDTLELRAFDYSASNVNWAVRFETCAASTGTVVGNVDGFSTPFSFVGGEFSADVNTTGWTLGDYCFVFNSGGVRLTQWFKVVEPAPVVLGSKDECKNGGWATSELPVFRNQGDCVSYFATSNSAVGNNPATAGATDERANNNKRR